jgi:hypothetical protein
MNWNNPLLQANTGDLYAVGNELASFDLFIVESSNVSFILTSRALKQMIIKFKNGNYYLYKDVTPEVIAAITDPKIESIGKFLNASVKGYFRYEEIHPYFEKASMTDIVKNYRNMQYTLNTNLGGMVTDKYDAISDLCFPDNIEDFFWKLEFTEQPDNCQRLK